MTTHAPHAFAEDDTLQVARPALSPSEPDVTARRSPRLAEMDLDPPSGPVPSEVLAYFEAALAREGERRRA